MRRILYECLDLSFPVGGVRRLYRHVEILNKHGFNARILHHTHGFRLPWLTSTLPIDYWTDQYQFTADDILVIPEGHVATMRFSSRLPCKRVVIALNWGNIFRNLAIGETWTTFGISTVIAGSIFEHDFILTTMGLESTTIVSGIDTTLFKRAADKQCSIACMPRKNEGYLNLIMKIFRAQFPERESVPWIKLDKQSHTTVAEALGRSAIFLAHTFPEGLSRKTLEAMACGNIVVGFAGGGSLECMEHLVNCYLAADGDVLQVATYLNIAISRFIAGQAGEMERAAVATARRYSLEKEEDAVVEYWQRILASD